MTTTHNNIGLGTETSMQLSQSMDSVNTSPGEEEVGEIYKIIAFSDCHV